MRRSVFQLARLMHLATILPATVKPIASALFRSRTFVERSLKQAGLIMNAKIIFVSAIGLFFVIALLTMRERSGHEAPRTPSISRVPDVSVGRSTSVQRVVNGIQRSDPAPDAERARDANAALEARVQTLERVVQRLGSALELEKLRTRVDELEQSHRRSRQDVAKAIPSSQASSIASLRREDTSLRRALEQLASKMASAQNKAYPTVNDLRVVQQKVFSLETSVRRLESR